MFAILQRQQKSMGAKISLRSLGNALLDPLLIILLLISPLMRAIAPGIKLSAPGQVLFVQRRYGLDGKAILVYKFRSMTVCEDVAKIRKATRNDKRITRLGAFLRKTSLDELPQCINVLQGRMSIVGPPAHAVAHDVPQADQGLDGPAQGQTGNYRLDPGEWTAR